MIPNLIIEFGPRAILSLTGILTIMSGVWYVDRTWDEKGSAAYKKAKIESNNSNNVIIKKKDLDAASPFPILFIVGWVIFAISYLFPTNGSAVLDFRPINIAAIVFSIILAFVASVPMGDAVRNRKSLKKKKLSMLFVLSWVGLTVASGFSANTGAPSFILGGVGAMFIIMSMKVLWKFRKMGDTWEKEGKPNPNPIVYNLGGPLFVFGWFLFWIGMASSVGGVFESGLPIYFNARTLLAFFAGCGMVPIVMMVDHAHDEGGKYLGFGTDGSHFGRLFESPIPFVIMWILFGLASFFAIDNTIIQPDTRRYILLANVLLQGIVAGGLIQTAVYKGNIVLKRKFSMIFVVLFLALAVNIGFHGGLALYLGLAGAVLVVLGQITVFKNRKRGDYWMVNKVVNPNPIVYSLGVPLFIIGWILLSLAMSQPML